MIPGEFHYLTDILEEVEIRHLLDLVINVKDLNRIHVPGLEASRSLNIPFVDLILEDLRDDREIVRHDSDGLGATSRLDTPGCEIDCTTDG